MFCFQLYIFEYVFFFKIKNVDMSSVLNLSIIIYTLCLRVMFSTLNDNMLNGT